MVIFSYGDCNIDAVSLPHVIFCDVFPSLRRRVRYLLDHLYLLVQPMQVSSDSVPQAVMTGVQTPAST